MRKHYACPRDCTCNKHNRCQPNCRCGRHKNSGARRIHPDMKCEILENNRPCGRPIKNARLNMCAMHAQRMYRTGTTEPLRLKPGPPKKGQTKPGSKIPIKNQGDPCLCAHVLRDHHEGHATWCKVEGCMCNVFDKTNRHAWQDKIIKLQSLMFSKVRQNEAFCVQCDNWVKIGFWYEPETVQRALAHSRRSCRNRLKPVVRSKLTLARTGPNGVG
jgi:hypothetical protein